MISCKSIYHSHEKSVLTDKQTNLNGKYSNCPKVICIEKRNADIDKIENPPLEDLLLNPNFGANEWGKVISYEGEIEIEVLSITKIKASLIKNGETIKSKIYKGKFINNYNNFSINQRKRFWGIPPLIYVYQAHKVDIGLTSDGYLVVYLSDYTFGGIFVFMGPSAFAYEVFFKKLE
jgi:hypothetical protein